MARKPNAVPPKASVGDLDIDDGTKTEEELVVVDEESGSTDGVQANGHDVVEETVESLKAQRDEALRRAEAAEQERLQAQSTVKSAQEQVVDSNLQVISNALGKAEADRAAIKAKIVAAKEAGDYAAETDALEELQAVTVKIGRLNEGKNELERRIEDAKRTVDPVEAYSANMQPRAKAWINSHRDLLVSSDGSTLDPEKMRRLERAHAGAIYNNHAPGTDSYFKFMEDELSGGGSSVSEGQAQKQDEVMPPSAPPSRSNHSSSPSSLPDGVQRLSNGSYRLSEKLRDAARISGLSDSEYLRNLLELQKEGRINLN